MTTPTMRVPRRLLARGARCVIALDEVGRGAAAGPVVVGAVRVDSATTRAPSGIKDSKLLSHLRRQELEPKIRRWAPCAIGSASSSEIDTYGLTAALRLAALRAISDFPADGGVILLDGSHDWITPLPASVDPTVFPPVAVHHVETLVRADLHCTPVAAASIIAKVYRDALMDDLATRFPQYAWQVNKGYLTAAHRTAIELHDLSENHRRSWSLRSAPPV